MGEEPDQKALDLRNNFVKTESSMEKERSYNKMTSPQQQIKYEFTNQDTVVFRIGG